MAHTNSTQNYNLPQWIGSDKPTFLGDLNNAFTDIDAQMKVNADSNVENADNITATNTLATTNRDNITALAQRVTDVEGDITEANSNISANANAIDSVTQTLSSLNTVIQGKQNLITGAASTITTTNLTAGKVLVSDSNGKVSNSSISDTELSRLSGATSNIQTQINKLKTWTKLLDVNVSDNDVTHSYINNVSINSDDELLIVVLNGQTNQILNTELFVHNMLNDDNVCRITILDVADGISGLALVTINPNSCTLRKFNMTSDIKIRIYGK